MINRIWIFICFMPVAFCFGQSQNVDSLLNVLKTSAGDTVKVNVLNDLFLQYEFEDDEKSKDYLNDALKLAKKNNYKRGLAKTFMYSGYFAEDKGNYPEAFKNYFISLKLYEEIGSKAGIASLYMCIGNVYNNQENYISAYKNYNSALELYTAIGDIREIATVRNNLGGVFYHLGNYSEALKNYAVSLEMSEKLKDKRGLANCNGNMGNLYQTKGEFDKSIEKYLIAMKLYDELGTKTGLAAIYANVGIINTKLKKYDESYKYLQKAKALSKKIGYNECLRDTYDALSELDSAKGNFKSAFEDHKLYIEYKDSIDNEQTRTKTIQSQMNYDFEKKEAVSNAEHKKELENQLALAEEKSRKQKIVLFLVFGSLILVIFFSGFIFRSLRLTKKQKILIEEQKNMVEEKQREIIDSIHYAKRIQRSLLPTEKYIDKNLKRLKNI